MSALSRRRWSSPSAGFTRRASWFLPKTKDPEYKELERFLLDVRDGGRPNADIEVGLQDSIAVMLSQKCMEEERKVHFSEIEEMGVGAKLTEGSKGKKA